MKIINHVYEDSDALIQFAEANTLAAAPSLLIQIFFSDRSSEAVYRVRKELLTLFPESAILATSTAGVISDGAMHDDTIVISFSVFEHSTVRTLGVRDQSAQDISASLAAHLITPKTKLLVLFANTFRFEASGLLRQLSRAFPHIAIAGGNAGDDYRFEHCEVFSDHADDCDVVFAAVDSDRLDVSTRYLLNWQSIGREMKVTKARGSEVFEIDGRSPVEIYRHYLGDDVADNILQYGIEFPLIFEDNGVDIARAPVAVNETTGAITFAGEIPDNAGVRFGYANIEHIEHLNKTMLSNEFTSGREGIYIYSCSARRQMLGGFLNDELAYINQIAPTAGFITYGEFFHDHTSCRNNLLNITTTFVVLQENAASEPMTFTDKGHRKDHHDIALKALTTLLDKTSSELDESIVYLDQFKRAVEEASIFSTSDADGIITDVNHNFEGVSGYQREELIGAPFNLLRMPNLPKALFREMWETIKSGRTWKGLIKNRHKDGSTYHVITLIVPIFHKNGSFKEYIAISNDVTELEEYKQLLKHELDTTSQNLHENLHYTEQYEAALNQTVAIVKTDADGTITYANSAFCDLSGYNTKELTGRNSRDILCPSFSAGASGFRPDGDQAVSKVLTNRAKDGTKYIVDTLIYPVMNLGGELIEYLYVMHDITEISQLNEEIATTQKEVVFTMGSIGESRSEETALHVRRVAEYAYHLAKLSGCSEQKANLIKDASPMHDIGKVAIPDNILKKPGRLTDEEYKLMKSHAMLGYELLKHSSRPLLKMSAELAYTHHEKWDGTGYPRGLRGEAIPLSGRILALADAFDALGHDRVYKKAWPLEEIFDYFKHERGKHFDPMLVDLFFENLDDFLHIYETMQE